MRELKIVPVSVVALCLAVTAACLRQGTGGIEIIDASLSTPTPTSTSAAPLYFLDAFFTSIDKNGKFDKAKSDAFKKAVKKDQPASKVAGAAASAAIGKAISSTSTWLASNGFIAGDVKARAPLGATLLFAGFAAAQEEAKASGQASIAAHTRAVTAAIGRSFSFVSTSDLIRPSEYASYVISSVSTVFVQLKASPLKLGGLGAADLKTHSTAFIGAFAGAMENLRTFARSDGTPYSESPASFVEIYAKTAGKMIPRLVSKEGQDAYVLAYTAAIVKELQDVASTSTAANAADVEADLRAGVAATD